jgi:hypothetical protein
MPAIIPIPALVDNYVHLLVQAEVAATAAPGDADDIGSFAVVGERKSHF